MKKLTVILLAGIWIGLPSGHVFAEGVPNTFTAGTTAMSSEINENFKFVNYGNITAHSQNGSEMGNFLQYKGDDLYAMSSVGDVVVISNMQAPMLTIKGMPYTFIAGTPAKAAEVNENFQFVNSGNIVAVDEDDSQLGSFLQYDGNDLYVMSIKGYILGYRYIFDNPNNPPLLNLYKADHLCCTQVYCGGDKFVPNGSPGIKSAVPKVLQFGDALYYTSAINETLPCSSYIATDNTCWESGGLSLGNRVYRNDESVTGVSNTINKTITPSIKLMRR